MLTHEQKVALVTKAAEGLLAQGGYCVVNGVCAYRGPDGRKCAVGFLIPDSYYEPEMNNKSIRRALKEHLKLQVFFKETYNVVSFGDIEFLQIMQNVLHDCRDSGKLPLLTVSEALAAMKLNVTPGNETPNT